MNQRFPFNIAHWTGTQDHPIGLRAGTHFRFDLDAVNRFCLVDLPPRLVDLLRIASAIYVVDRLVKRQPRKPDRTIGLKIEVFDDAFWKRELVRDATFVCWISAAAFGSKAMRGLPSVSFSPSSNARRRHPGSK